MALTKSTAERRKMLGISAEDVEADKAKQVAALTAKQKSAAAKKTSSVSIASGKTSNKDIYGGGAQPAPPPPKTEEKKGILKTAGENIMTGIKASLGLGEPKQYDPGSALGKVSGAVEELNRAQVPLALMGAATAGGFGAGGAWIPAKTLKATQAAKLAKVGTSGISPNAASTAGKIASNSKTAAQTTTWLSGLVSAVKNPAVVVSTLMGAIGSYPFAGFIKEESLQTIGFATNSAIHNGDIEGAEAALAMQEEVLNPGVWDKIMQAVPFANVLKNLKDFYDAAKLKTTIDKKIVSDLKIQAATGETEDSKWERLNQEKDNMEKSNIDYYNEERKKLLAWEEEAADRDMREDASFWASEREKQAEFEAADRKAIAEFWEEYKKRMQKLSDDNRPSNLNFGLIR